MFGNNRTLPLIVFLLLMQVSNAFGANVSFSWQANNESDLAGYRVYYGNTSGVYEQVKGNGIDAGTSTEYGIKVALGSKDKTYYMAVTAYDSSGNESPYSDEVVVFVPSLTKDSDNDMITDIEEIKNGTDPARSNIIVDASADRSENPGKIVLTGIATDLNGSELTTTWVQLSGEKIALNSLGLTASFTAFKAGDYEFRLTATDANKASVSDTVVINIKDAAPVADAGQDQSVQAGDIVTLAGSGTDGNKDELFFTWIQKDGLVFDKTNPSASFQINVAGEYTFGLMVTDKAGNQSFIDEAVVKVADKPSAITSKPGVVELNSSITGGDLNYKWAQIDGPASVKMPGGNSPAAKLTVLNDGAYTFKVTATNASNVSASQEFHLIVENVPPDADAGPGMTINSGKLVSLSGKGTDVNNDPLTFEWSQHKDNPDVVEFLTNCDKIISAGVCMSTVVNNIESPSITFEKSGVYKFDLVVIDDNNERSKPATTTVNVNQVPVANAGLDQTVYANAIVSLDGSASKGPDDKPLYYAWKLVASPKGTSEKSIKMSRSTKAAVSFVPSVTGIYKFSLIVSDGTIKSGVDTVTVVVNNAKYFIPAADAGNDQTVLIGRKVQLGGGKSSSYGKLITYAWSQLEGAWVEISNPLDIAPTFTPLQAGAYKFELIVSDGQNNSIPDTVIVNVQGVNSMPVADAGKHQDGITGTTVVLNGSLSKDPDNDFIKYFWTQTSGASVVLSNSSSVYPQFMPATPGLYQFELKVFDGELYSNVDTVTVSISAGNMMPVANAGADITVSTGNVVTLDGSKSSDAENSPLVFIWRQAKGTSVKLNYEAASPYKFTFKPSKEGTYVFTLVVNDGSANSMMDTVNVTVLKKVVTNTPVKKSAGGFVNAVWSDFNVYIVIEPDMLDSDASVSIGESDIKSPFANTIGSVISLEPSELVFNKPVQVKIKINTGHDINNVVVMSYDDSTTQWQELSVKEKGDDFIVVEVRQLGKLALGKKKADKAANDTNGAANDNNSPSSDALSDNASVKSGGCGFIRPAGNGNNGTGSGTANLLIMVSIAMLIPLLRRLGFSK